MRSTEPVFGRARDHCPSSRSTGGLVPLSTPDYGARQHLRREFEVKRVGSIVGSVAVFAASLGVTQLPADHASANVYAGTKTLVEADDGWSQTSGRPYTEIVGDTDCEVRATATFNHSGAATPQITLYTGSSNIGTETFSVGGSGSSTISSDWIQVRSHWVDLSAEARSLFGAINWETIEVEVRSIGEDDECILFNMVLEEEERGYDLSPYFGEDEDDLRNWFIEDPVAASIGNFADRWTDLDFDGVSAPLQWERSYNGRDLGAGVLGPGWSTVLDMAVTYRDETERALRLPNGREVHFVDDGQGAWSTSHGFDGEFLHNVDGSYTVQRLDGVRWEFDSDGQVEQWVWWDGTELDFVYQGSLVSDLKLEHVGPTATTSLGSLTFTYGVGNRLERVVASDGREVTYTYSSTSNPRYLDSVATPAGTTTLTLGEFGRIEELYDEAGVRIVSNQLTPTFAVQSQTNSSGVTSTFSYDLALGQTTVTNSATTDVLVLTYDPNDGTAKDATDTNLNTLQRSLTPEGFLDGFTDRENNTFDQTVDARGAVSAVIDRSGNETRFEYDAEYRLTKIRRWHDDTASWADTDLRYNSDERIPYEIEDPYGEKTTNLVVDGLLEQSTDPDGVVTDYGYIDRQLTSVQVGSLAATTFTYDAAGRRDGRTTPEGVITHWLYDDAGRLIATTEEGLPGSSDDIVTEWVYDSAGRLLQEIGQSVVIGSSTQTDITTHHYDPATGLLAWTGDARGYCIFYDYVDGRLDRVRAPSNFLTQTGAALQSGETCADKDGLADGQYVITSYEYDVLSRVDTVTDPAGVVTKYTYTDNGWTETVTVGFGTADAQTTTYDYDGEGRITGATDGNSNLTTTTFDSMGLVESVVVDPGGLDEVIHYDYDLAGRLVATTLPDGAKTTRTYTPAGRIDLVSGSRNIANDPTTACTDPLCDTTDHDYDTNGRLESIANGRGGATQLAYNDDGQLTSTTSAENYLTTYGYDEYGRRNSVTGPDGETWTQHFNERHELVERRDPAGTTVAQFTYDQDGRIRTAIDGEGSGTVWAYDSRGNLLITATPGAPPYQWYWSLYSSADQLVLETNPLGHQTAYAYTPAGQLDTVTDATGRSIDHDYDAGGRRSSTTHTIGPDVFTSTFGYDTANRRTSVIDPTGQTVWSLDDRGRPDTVTYPDSSVWDYDYDSAGNLIKVTYADASTVDFRYDEANFLEEVDSSELGAFDYTTDLDGRVQYVDLPGVDYRDLDYHAPNTAGAGQLETLVESLSGTTTTWGLVYDDRGRLTQHNRNAVGTGDDDTTYTYDNADQLDTVTVGVTGTSNDVDFDYTHGRRDTMTLGDGTVHTYSYNVLGWLQTETVGSSTYNYTYDFAGRRTSGDRNGVDWTADYGPHGLVETITTVDGSDTTTEDRVYDGLGRLAEVDYTYPDTSTASYTLRWSDDSRQDVLSISEASGGSDSLIYGHQRLGFSDGVGTGLFSTDGLGSAITTSGTADLVRSESYAAYGEPDGASSGLAPDTPQFGYRGELHLGEHIHLRARDLHPATGLFTTSDPIPPVPGTPVTSTAYHYANNNPTNMIDPTGLLPNDDQVLGNSTDWAAAGTACAGLISADGALVIGDAICVGLLTYLGVMAFAGALGLDEPRDLSLPDVDITNIFDSDIGSSHSEQPNTSTTLLPLLPDTSTRDCVATALQSGCGEAEVLVDTSAVYKFAVLVPMLEARGERGVISSQVELELQRNKLHFPAHPFTLVPDVANSVAMARMRQQFPNHSAQGVEGDIIIGTTAISTGRKLYTSDSSLAAAVINAGGIAEYVP